MATPGADRETVGNRDEPVVRYAREVNGPAHRRIVGDCKPFWSGPRAALWRVRELLDDLLEDIKTGDTEALDDPIEDLQLWQEWLMLHRFDRRRVNRRLR